MLTLKNLSLTAADAQGRADIVKNVSLDVEDGKFLVITGPNGGGKTTLAKLIMGLATPTGGQIFLDGEDITGLSITDRAKRGISYSFQQPPRFKGITVHDLLRRHPFLAGLDGDGHAVFVASADRNHVAAPEPQVTGINVRRYVNSRQMADMHRTVGIGKSRGNEITLEFFCHKNRYSITNFCQN